jgi:hypothetical protein
MNKSKVLGEYFNVKKERARETWRRFSNLPAPVFNRLADQASTGKFAYRWRDGVRAELNPFSPVKDTRKPLGFNEFAPKEPTKARATANPFLPKNDVNPFSVKG